MLSFSALHHHPHFQHLCPSVVLAFQAALTWNQGERGRAKQRGREREPARQAGRGGGAEGALRGTLDEPQVVRELDCELIYAVKDQSSSV